MKNIFLFITCLFCAPFIFAQSSVSDVPAKTVRPAKVKEPVVSSTTNAIQPATEKKVVEKDNSGSIAPTQATKTIDKPVDNSGSIAPVKQMKVEANAVSRDVINSTNTGSQIPVAEKQVNVSNRSNSSNNLNSVETRVNQSVENSNTIPGQPVNLLTKPLLPITVSAANAELILEIESPSKAVNANKLPEVKFDNTKQLKLEEVPASVINPATKAPPVPTQTAEKAKTKNKE